jgi:ABC-type phosphate/phosphonate transport system ATPase subunit
MGNEIILKLENISKYFTKNEILNNINLSINRGDRIAIIGSSGAGKTTLLNILALITR